MHALVRATAAVTGLGAAAAAYSSLVERQAYVLRTAEVPVLPAGAEPLRVLHLSDLHLMPGQRRKIRWVRALARTEPHLIINTGDNIAHPKAIEPVLEAYEPFLGLPGAFVLGSNDYYAPGAKNPLHYVIKSVPKPDTPPLPTAELVAGLTGRGWLDLTNARGSLEVAGGRIDLVGVDDPHLRYDDYPAVAEPARLDALLTVGVSHAPYTRVLDAMHQDGARLLIAGHTHGGQLAVPLYGALVTNCDLDTRRVKGLSRWWPGANGRPSREAPADASWLHVSAGLGTSPWVPFRFAARPEATLLTLVPRS